MRGLTGAGRLAGGLVAVLMLGGCGGSGGSSTASVTPAPSAGDVGCASLLGRLPGTLAGQTRASTSVSGAAVWGTTSPIVLRCGVTPPGPSTDPCNTVNGIDWLYSDTKDAYVFTLFGRVPAVELTVPHTYDGPTASGTTAQLTAAVKPLTVTRSCVGEDEASQVPTPT